MECRDSDVFAHVVPLFLRHSRGGLGIAEPPHYSRTYGEYMVCGGLGIVGLAGYSQTCGNPVVCGGMGIHTFDGYLHKAGKYRKVAESQNADTADLIDVGAKVGSINRIAYCVESHGNRIHAVLIRWWSRTLCGNDCACRIRIAANQRQSPMLRLVYLRICAESVVRGEVGCLA